MPHPPWKRRWCAGCARHTRRKPKPQSLNRQHPNLPRRNLRRAPRAERTRPLRSRARRNQWRPPELQPRLPRPARQSPHVRFPNLPRAVRAPSPGRLTRARPHLNSRLHVPERTLVQEAASLHPRTVPDPVQVPVQGPVPVAPHPPRVHMCAVPAPRVPATIRSRFPKEWALDVPERSDVIRDLGRVATSECRVPVALEACPAPTPR